MLNQTEFYLSAEGLKNPSIQVLDGDFEFIVGEKKYPCSSYIAEFISPAVAELRFHDPTVKSFSIDIEDPNNYFELVLNLMKGIEIEANVPQSVFLTKIGKILKNEELVEAFSFSNNEHLTNENALATFQEKKELHKDTSKEKDYIAKHFCFFNQDEFLYLDLESLHEILSSENLFLLSEDSLFTFITNLIDKRGSQFKELLQYVRYDKISQDVSQSFPKYLTAETIQNYPELWESIKKRLLLECEEVSFENRYIHTEIRIPYNPKNPFNGIFSYLTAYAGKNPIDAKLVETSVLYTNCNVPASALMNYKEPPTKWYLTEKENSWICFDFKKAKIAMNAYTMSSGPDSSYWEYPVSFTWEGSNDNLSWTPIDIKPSNTEMGGNEKTYTWVMKEMSPFYRFVRFRIWNVTRSGGLYTTRMELFGAYKPPDDMGDFFYPSTEVKK